ncbi:MAG: L,D-transpeptidase family protein [Limisphaerales bacterium]
MTTPTSTFGKFSHACKTQGVVPTPFVLIVSVANQTVSFFEKSALHSGGRQTAAFSGSRPRAATGEFKFVKKFRCSTSRFGIGQIEGSYRTPLGLHRVVEKIGGGWPPGTVFKGRRPIGHTWQGMPDAKITTRILWLEGLEPGFNRGGNVDSHARYIYIHGTGDQTTIGKPMSCGCIHLADTDLIPLFDQLPGGTLVWIRER